MSHAPQPLSLSAWGAGGCPRECENIPRLSAFTGRDATLRKINFDTATLGHNIEALSLFKCFGLFLIRAGFCSRTVQTFGIPPQVNDFLIVLDSADGVTYFLLTNDKDNICCVYVPLASIDRFIAQHIISPSELFQCLCSHDTEITEL